MITFTKSTNDGMVAFKNTIRDKIVEMAADVISPIYGDWDAFDKEIAHKLNTREIDYTQAHKLFAEDYYSRALDGMRIVNCSVVFDDEFDVEGTFNDGNYELDHLVKEIKKIYPDTEVFGAGYINYHYTGISYLLIASGDKVIFVNDQEEKGGSWIDLIRRFLRGESIEDFTEEDDEFSVTKWNKQITRFLSKKGLNFSSKELMEKMGLDKNKNPFE